MTPADKEWLAQGRARWWTATTTTCRNRASTTAARRCMFWALAVCMLLLIGLRHPDLARLVRLRRSTLVRLGAVVHAAAGAVMIGLIMVHVYAAIWVKGTIRAMWYGTVTRAWAKQHHRGWYRQVTGK